MGLLSTPYLDLTSNVCSLDWSPVYLFQTSRLFVFPNFHFFRLSIWHTSVFNHIIILCLSCNKLIKSLCFPYFGQWLTNYRSWWKIKYIIIPYLWDKIATKCFKRSISLWNEYFSLNSFSPSDWLLYSSVSLNYLKGYRTRD